MFYHVRCVHIVKAQLVYSLLKICEYMYVV